MESEREPFQPGDLDGEMVLKVLAGDTVEEMTLGEYLVGVVRAEMPASFEPEALKAQAVAARTYTLYKMQTGGNHGEDVYKRQVFHRANALPTGGQPARKCVCFFTHNGQYFGSNTRDFIT